MIQEITIKKLYTPTSTIYIIPESSHLRECRLEDLNTLLFFPPSELEWKKSPRSAPLLWMPSAADAVSSAHLISEKVKVVGNSPYIAPSVKRTTITEGEN
jgi:hypothetical protein